jgi:diguanylate cyclase (GGDEF)-like protein
MSLRRKFYILFGLIAGLAVGLAAYGVVASGNTGDLVVRLYDEPLVGVNYARAASATLNQARGAMQRDLLLGPGLPSTDIAPLRGMEADIADDLRIVRQREHDAAIVAALDHAQISIAAWFSSGGTILAPPAEGVTRLPMPSVVDRQGTAAAALLDDLVELVAAQGFAFRSRAQDEMHTSSLAFAGLSVGIIVVGALFAVLFAHLLIRPILAATRIAEAVAGGTTVTVLATTRRDEIGRLLNSLTVMQENLRSRAAHAASLVLEKEQAADMLRQINVRFDAALNNMSHGVLMCDDQARVVVVNHRYCEIYGIDHNSIRPGTPYRDVVGLSVEAGNYPGRTVDELLTERAPIQRLRQPATAIRSISGGRTTAVSYEPMPDGGWIATHEDITERRRSEQQIVFLAQHDALTRLANRVLFQERLDQALVQAKRGAGFALLWLDLDQFKAVNDTLGHPIGDSLLCAVADRLLSTVRDGDIVARLGGDEFAILQHGVSGAEAAIALARRIVEMIGAPYELEGNRVVIGTSIGIALAPMAGADAAQLLKGADLALYRAKQDGRGRWRLFEAEMDAAAQARRALELDLHSALALGQFELHYQPLVCTRRRCVTGFEALLRWRHETRGLVAPGEFISVAEEIGIILPIGEWVLHRACAAAAAWPDHLRVAVNLSPRQFRGETLLATVTSALRATGLAPDRLELEITESVPLRDDQATLSVMHRIRVLGVRIALDDFGTGYSSLSYLRSFPFDTIKIDRSFTSEAQTRDDCAAIVRAITALGGSLQVNTTGEGVETEEQFEFLAAAGCTEVQGYLFGRPTPLAMVPAVIRRLSGRLVAVPSVSAAVGD